MLREKLLPTIALSLLASVLTAPAALVLTFTNASGTFSEGSYTVSSLQDGTPTESGDALTSRTTPTGSLSGVDNTVSFSFAYDTFASSELSGTTLDLTNVSASNMASNGNGIASADGDIAATTGRGIFFRFDLSAFAPDTNLRITAATATGTGTLQLVVGSDPTGGTQVDGLVTSGDPSFAGVTTTTLGGLSGSGLSVDVAGGDYLMFRNVGETGSFRLTSLTLEAVAIPEPAAALLGSFGLLCLLRRRR